MDRDMPRVCEGMHNIILKITVVSLIISSLYCRYFYNINGGARIW